MGGGVRLQGTAAFGARVRFHPALVATPHFHQGGLYVVEKHDTKKIKKIENNKNIEMILKII